MYIEDWCTQCGICCDYFDVNVTPKELKALLEVLSETEKQEFLKQVKEIEKDVFHWRNPCFFIQKISDVKTLCRVHDIKPQMCIDWDETRCKKLLDRLEAENPTPIDLDPR